MVVLLYFMEMLKFFFAAVFSILATPALCQHGKYSPDKIGAVIGLNFHTQVGLSDQDINAFYKLGYSFGLQAIWNVGKLSIHSGVVTEQKGHQIEYRITYLDDLSNPQAGEITEMVYLNYLTLPITLHCYPLKSKKIYFEGGLYGSWLYKARQKKDFSWKAPTGNNSSEGFKAMDAGVVFGIGGELANKSAFSINIRILANFGLVNVNPGVAYSDKTLRNFSVGPMLTVTKH